MGEHLVHTVILLFVAGLSYYAGCRNWLGKW